MTDAGLSVMGWYRVSKTSVLVRRCAVSFSFLIALGLQSGARADAWHTFQSRCLDAFEAFSPAPVSDLPQITQAAPSPGFSDAAVAFGPTQSGDVIVLDPAPLLEGDRLCAVSGHIQDRHEIAGWVAKQVLTDRYEMAREGAATVLLSLEWIEPRLQVTLVLEGVHAGTYSVLETYLEG